MGDRIVSGGGRLFLVVLAGDTLDMNDIAVLVTGDGEIVARGVINAYSGLIVNGDGNIAFGEEDPNSHLTADQIGLGVFGSGNVTNYGEVDAGIIGLLSGDISNLFNLDATAGAIHNYGDVDGGLFGAAVIGTGTITNHAGGVIEGDIASVAAIGRDFVINNNAGATIEEGFIGAFGYGSGTMNNSGLVHADAIGMVFISEVSIDEDALAALLAGPNGGDPLAFYLTGIGDLVNSIEFQGGVTVNNDGLVQAPVGVLLLGNGTINNSGEITGDPNSMGPAYLGIGAYGNVNINNSGVIHGNLIGAALIGNINIDTEFVGDLFSVPADPDAINDLGFLFYIAAALNAIEFEGGGTITNSGDIGYDTAGNYAPGTIVGAIQLGNGNVINTEEGRIAADFLGMGLYGNGNLINHGEVGTDGIGMLFIGDISFDDDLFFNIEEAIALGTPGDFFGPINFGSGTIVNTGHVYGNLAGIVGIGNVTINNNGYVDVDGGLAGIAGIGPNVAINNTGIIDHAMLGIVALGDNVVVNNSGTIAGDVLMGVTVYGNGTVNNSGFISTDGPAITAYGDVTVNLRGGSVTDSGFAPAVVGDDNNQTVNVDGVVNVIPSLQDVIALEGGEDRVNLRSNADVRGGINMGEGDDTVQISSGARVTGVIDGGDHVNGDRLIVGNETICGEAEGASQRFFGTRELVAGINLADDTFSFDGEDYTILNFEEGRSGVRQTRCFPFIEDGRINAYDMGASVAGYCNTLEGVNVWAIDTDGNGQVDFSVSGEQMRTALQEAVTGGQNVLVAQGARGSSLYALSSNEYQMMRLQPDGKTYAYIFEPGRCGPAGVYTAE